MTWTRLSDDFGDRDAMLRVSRSARLLHVEALVWCNRAGNNGRLPFRALSRLTDADDPQADARELVRAGLWVVEEDGCWQIDWDDQELAEDVKVRQDASKLRQRRRRLHLNGEHKLCLERFCRDAPRDTSRVVTRDRTRDDTTTHPIPSRPGPKGQGPGGKKALRCPNGAIVSSDGECCDECAASVRVRSA